MFYMQLSICLILRDMIQPMIRPACLCFLLRALGSHQDLLDNPSSSVCRNFEQYPLKRNLLHVKILFFLQPALRYHVVVCNLFFLCSPYVTRIQWALDKNPQNSIDSFSSGSILTTSQEDGDNKDSLNELPFSSQSTWMKLHSVQTGQLALSQTVTKRIKKVCAKKGHACCMKKCCDSFTYLTANKTRGRNGEKIYSVTHICLTGLSGSTCSFCVLRRNFIKSFSWVLLGVTQSTSPFFALHHHHGPRLHLPDCMSLEPVSTLEAPLRQSSDSRAEWLTTHQPQVMSPSRLLFKTCIDVSSEYRPINFAVRRENFDIKDD